VLGRRARIARTLVAALTAALALAGAVALPPAHGLPQRQLAIEEDDPGWDCRTDGNLLCGPGNDQGVPAGYYGEIDE